MAAVQKNTESGSTVIMTEPNDVMGVTVITAKRTTAARPLTSRVKNRRRKMDVTAAITGEKKRTPNALSPQREVPRNWVTAMSGGLL